MLAETTTQAVPGIEAFIYQLITSPQMWAVGLIIAMFYGIYKILIRYVPEWLDQQNEHEEKRTQMIIDSNEKIAANQEKLLNNICSRVDYLGEKIGKHSAKIDDLGKKIEELKKVKV